MPGGPVQSAYAAADDPQVRHRGALVPLRHPLRDEPTGHLGPAMPVRLSRATTDLQPAELLGASTGAVLNDLAGVTEAELADLVAAGVVEVAPARDG